MDKYSIDTELQDRVARSILPADLEIGRQVTPLVNHIFGDGMSTIDPSVKIWAAEPAEELRRRIEDNPLEGPDSQWTKLKQQLDGAPRDVILLAAEIVFLRDHPVRTLKPTTRRSHVEHVLEKLTDPLSIGEPMEQWLSRSSGTAGFDGGIGYLNKLWKQIVWAANFVEYLVSCDTEDRQRARRDPWFLQELMVQSGDDRSDIRNAFQFLFHPDTFEPISSQNIKMTIADAFSHLIGGRRGTSAQDVDRDLFDIRAELARDVDGPFGFWTPGVREQWKTPKTIPSGTGSSSDVEPEPRERHYWVYSPGSQASEWNDFYSEGIMAIAWDEVGDIADYPSKESIRQRLDITDSGMSHKNDVLALWQFQNEIEVGDVVYAKRGRREVIGRGVVTSEARFDSNRNSYQHVRSVDWTHNGSWEHPRKDASTKTLTDITKYPRYVAELKDLFDDEGETELSEIVEKIPGYTQTDFLSEVFLDKASYDQLKGLLDRKKNLILAGPPGVGKTFMARRLAYSIMGVKDPTRIRMIQFHQSYSYEDFMMGYRPNEEGGFGLHYGPFYRFCEEAAEDDQDKPYFFIIDEINRGNISKIFGELLMLIEADKRDQSVRLLYLDERFAIPPNVYIIGMMNTADRSLAVLDYALRRRFGFFTVEPSFDSSGFKAHQEQLENPKFDALVREIQNLNKEIAGDPALGDGFMIGHSYLMASPDVEADDAWIYSVVEYEIIPLLQEYWFDEPTRVMQWSDRLRSVLQ